MKSLIKKYKIHFIAICAIALLFLYPSILFFPMGWLLSRDDHPKPNADFTVLLMGEPHLRPEAAAKAVLGGSSDKLLFVTSEINALEDAGLMPSEDVLAKAMIEKTGLSLSRVIVVSDFGRATSTADEALAIAKYFRSQIPRPQRIVIVTSWPHASRAAWIFEKALNNSHVTEDVTVEMMPIDSIPFDKSNWWHSERGLLFVFEEYVKWARYLAKYIGRDLI